MHKGILYLKVHHLHLGRSMLTMTSPLSTMLLHLSLLTFFSDEIRCLALTSMIFFRSGQQLFLRIRSHPLWARMTCTMPSITLILEGHHGIISPWSTMLRSERVMWPHGSTNPLRSGISRMKFYPSLISNLHAIVQFKISLSWLRVSVSISISLTFQTLPLPHHTLGAWVFWAMGMCFLFHMISFY